MRNTVIWSFLSLVALATGGLVVGCDGDAKLARSGAGDSCTKTADCDDGLRCEEGTCYKPGSSTGGSANAGGDNTGATTTGPAPVVLGGEGESCTKHTDCEDTLGCFNQRCVMSPQGAGGEGSGSGVVLGLTGETCATSADCEKGLSCVPGGYTQPGIGFVGVCSEVKVATPSGKSCGAECKVAQDCCELPIELHQPYSLGIAPYGTGAKSCTELTTMLGKANCAKPATLTAVEAAQCFALATYCECKDTWTCDAGACHYAADCSADGAVPGGCPTYSRSGLTSATITCNADSKCALDVAATPCKKDADCDAKTTADTAETCAAGECTCYKADGACYRKCDNTLDCAAGYDCDTKTSVCVKSPSCTTDEECAVTLETTHASCVAGVCQRTCAVDYDCGTTAVLSTASQVCGPDHVCKPIGCSTDAQCIKAVGIEEVHMFCTDDVAGTATGVRSAITD